MQKYSDATLFYRQKIGNRGDFLAVCLIKKEGDSSIHEVYWLAEASNCSKTHGFTLYKVEIIVNRTASTPMEGFSLEGNLTDLMDQNNTGLGGSFYAKGHCKELKQMAAGTTQQRSGVYHIPDWSNITKIQLLPSDDVESFKLKIGALRTARAGDSSQYERYENAFIDVFMNHLEQAFQAIATNNTKLFESLFKGLSVGRSYTPAGFFMKGIKSAYDTIGFYRKTYDSKLRLAKFELADLIDYVSQHRTAFPASWNLDFAVVPDITKIDKETFAGYARPGPHTIDVTGTLKGIPDEYKMIVNDTLKHWKTTGLKMPFRRGQGDKPYDEVVRPEGEVVLVSEYGFRGDTRSPLVLLQSGGLHPNAIRHFIDVTKQQEFEAKRDALIKQADEELGSHKHPHWDPFLHQYRYDAISVFLSVSKTPFVGFHFVNIGGGTGFVYLLRCLSAIDQEATFLKSPFHESEISVPGGVDWESVIAFRPVKDRVLADYCYYKTNNKWAEKEEELQKAAIHDLMHMQVPLRHQKKYGNKIY